MQRAEVLQAQVAELTSSLEALQASERDSLNAERESLAAELAAAKAAAGQSEWRLQELEGAVEELQGVGVACVLHPRERSGPCQGQLLANVPHEPLTGLRAMSSPDVFQLQRSPLSCFPLTTDQAVSVHHVHAHVTLATFGLLLRPFLPHPSAAGAGCTGPGAG